VELKATAAVATVPVRLFAELDFRAVLAEHNRLQKATPSSHKWSKAVARFRWTFESRFLRDAITDVKSQISELHEIMRGGDEDRLQRVLLASVTVSDVSQDLMLVEAATGDDKDIQNAVGIKLLRTKATSESQDSSTSSPQSQWILDVSCFSPRMNPLQETSASRTLSLVSRAVGAPHDTHVMVEWKKYTPASAEKAEYRAYDLCRLLQKSSQQDGFHTLNTFGFIRDDGRHRLGITLVYPAGSATSSVPVTLLDTLHNDSRSSKIPLLGDRFEFAKNVARAFYRFLCTNWMHKSFRSSNILGFTSASRDISWPTSFFFAGFDLSRPDSIDELSERPESDPINDRYRHPEDVRNASEEGKYKKFYDIYSLGVVLLEIALWRPISSFAKDSEKLESFQESGISEAVSLVKNSCGSKYSKAVNKCLRGDLTMAENGSPHMKLLMAFEEEVVVDLETCSA
jgi:hypothetical protein